MLEISVSHAKLADEVAAEWVAVQPDAKRLCMKCGDWFPVQLPGKAPSLQCPKCGHLADKQSCELLRPAIVALGVKLAEEAVKAEATPAPAEESRGDPPGLDDVIGNRAAVLWIRTVLDAFRSDLAKLDGRTKEARAIPFPHTLWSGPSGCVAGFTRIFDPTTGRHPTIEQLYRDNIQPWVLTIHGPERAGVPFLKGYADLYEVCLESGRRITVQQDHRFLSTVGWRKMIELRIGDAIASSERDGERPPQSAASHPLSTSDTSRSTHRPSVGHCPDTKSGSRECCSVCSCPCGGQPRKAEAACPAPSPLQDDAGVPCCGNCDSGGRENTQEHIHRHLRKRHPSMRGSCLPLDGREHTGYPTVQSFCEHNVHAYREGAPFLKATYRPCSILQSGDDASPTFCAAPESGLASTLCRVGQASPSRSRGTSQEPATFGLGCGRLPPTAATAIHSLPLDDPYHFSCCPSCSPKRVRWDKIKSIVLAAKNQPFYDLTVPMAQHYLAEGIWNHNTGKTTLAQIIAREINRPIHFQMGQSLTSPGRVGDVLLSLKAGDILFIDEVHGLRPICQETLYRAMEDGVYIPIAKAGSPVVKPIHLPPFTLMGATTDIWGLLPPMLQRFKVSIRLKRLSADELAQAMLGRAVRAGLVLTPPAATMIGERSLGTPRLAIRLLDGCLATAKAQGKAEINAEIVTMTCRLLEIDRLGLDDDAQKYLGFLLDAGNDPVRVNVLASRLEGLSRLTLERRIEPDLIFLGLIDKKEKGRVLTAAGREHLREIK